MAIWMYVCQPHGCFIFIDKNRAPKMEYLNQFAVSDYIRGRLRDSIPDGGIVMEQYGSAIADWGKADVAWLVVGAILFWV